MLVTCSSPDMSPAPTTAYTIASKSPLSMCLLESSNIGDKKQGSTNLSLLGMTPVQMKQFEQIKLNFARNRISLINI